MYNEVDNLIIFIQRFNVKGLMNKCDKNCKQLNMLINKYVTMQNWNSATEVVANVISAIIKC
jgi:hypothetical protein